MAVKSKIGSLAAQALVRRRAMILWICAGVIALLGSWAYGIAAVLMVTFLHLAMLDGLHQVDGENR